MVSALGDADRWSKANPLIIDILVALALAAVLGSLTISSLQDIDVRSPWLTGAAFGLLHVSVALRRTLSWLHL